MRITGAQWLGLVGFLAACYLVAGIGSIFTAPAIKGWYRGLHKPSFNPPNWVFGPVWGLLYFMMALAAWMVWQRVGLGHGAWPLWLFTGQLVLNLLWSFIFFGLRRPGWAMAEIVLLWLAIGATAIAFWQVWQAAGWLMAPYWGWVTFAAVLNFAIWRLNP